MSVIWWVGVGGVALLTLDFILGIYYGRCVIPGLKCGVCRTRDRQAAEYRRLMSERHGDHDNRPSLCRSSSPQESRVWCTRCNPPE